MNELFELTRIGNSKKTIKIGTRRNCELLKYAIVKRSTRKELDDEKDKNFKIRKLC